MAIRLDWRLLCGAASVVASVVPAAIAQETTVLEEITVIESAGNGEKGALTTTAEREEIERKMVGDVTDLGRVDASVGFSASTKSINLRGLDRNRVLTTIDGIRVPWLNDPRESAQGGLNSIDLDMISAIDITRGADSMRYGSGALGGVIGFRTLDPEELIEEGRNWGAIVKGAYDSADTSWRTNAAIAARAGDTYFLLQGGYRRGHELDNKGTVGGYAWNRTEPNPSDYEQSNFLVKLHQHVGDIHRFRFAGERFRREETAHDMVGTYSSPARNTGSISQLYEEGTLYSGDAVERDRISAGYDFQSPDGDAEAHFTAYWMRQRLDAITEGVRLPDARGSGADPFLYRFPFGPYYRDNQLMQTAYGVLGDGRREFDLGGFSHTLRLGMELYRQKTHQYSAGEDNCPDVDWLTIPSFMGPQNCRFLHSNASDMPDVDSVFIGFHAENDIHLPGNFTLTPGIRFDWYDHQPVATPEYLGNPNFAGMPASNGGSNISASLRGSWQATADLELYAQWAQAFRAPTANELYQNFGAPGSYLRLGNPGLKAETSNGFEIGASYDNGTLAVTASVFSNFYRNFIDQVQTAPEETGAVYPLGIFEHINRARVHIHGAELRGEWNFTPNWRGWGSLAWMVGRDTGLDQYLNSIPPLRAIAGIGYDNGNWGSDVAVRMAASRDKVGPGGFRSPAYAVADLMAWWEPEQLPGLRLQAGVFNIFDTKYWDALKVDDNIDPALRDRYSEPGRSFRFTVSKRF
jgi:hemoglobin/transferrin/lactoferrin receptor protein